MITARVKLVAIVCCLALVGLVACRDDGAAPAAPPESTGADESVTGDGSPETPPSQEQLDVLLATVRNPESSPEERRQALVEHARLLGKEVPPALLETPAKKFHVEIELPDGPPASDPLVAGTYVLSTRFELSGNRPAVEERQACEVEVDGTGVTIRLNRAPKTAIVGECRDGRIRLRGEEGDLRYELTGQIVGPRRAAGRVTSSGVEIEDGRWSLERVR